MQKEISKVGEHRQLPLPLKNRNMNLHKNRNMVEEADAPEKMVPERFRILWRLQ